MIFDLKSKIIINNTINESISKEWLIIGGGDMMIIDIFFKSLLILALEFEYLLSNFEVQP